MLLQLRDIHVSYGTQVLMDGVGLTLEPGERVALVGRNGAGKSTLMKLIAGEIAPDAGQRECPPGIRVARLEQDVPADAQGSSFEMVSAGLGDVGALVARYHALAARMAAGDADPALGAELSRVQAQIDAQDGWTLNEQIEAVMGRLGLDPEARFEALSGGLKRRVLMARAWARQPDVLLLDEPTNHLDIEAIAELESLLLEWSGALLFITHDRAFLRRLATRILDLDRGTLSSWPGDYDRYLAGKAKALEDEAAAQRAFDKTLAAEEVWIRQGIKARRTRNEGRVRALKALRQERAQRRERMGTARFKAQDAQDSARQVIVAEAVNFSHDGLPLVRDFSCRILRGDKIGIIGRNGVGKTTLIQLLLGELEPDSGTIELGSRVSIAHFDQLRGSLDPQASVADNVAQGRTHVEIDGQPRHVISYLQDFLFSPERARTPVRVLSGGERNRLLLARLFTKPANLLVMDEPTNDLDVETLELLEERLIDYSGTLLLVSHDRAFLDNVVTSTLVFEGEGRIGEYVGGYTDMLRQRSVGVAAAAPAAAPSAKPRPSPAPPTAKGPQLSRDERRELMNLPARIEKLEQQLSDAQAVFASPDFHKADAAKRSQAQQRLADCEQALEQAMARWERLESQAAGI